ncbi:thiamine pyrophosphokinase [Mucilaginibacter conchicola]|uniref:Thiamine pyrophosphokinase n=1 Tax=Mucilaginibacter conchicola TaxID=2303333 RepID=A0A372NT08_9SPHI|nr:thiamine pyrophosphokinase [Mucilaginibacter conchicola]RFZ92396.1 thiamine pyrophosphokinase [Mucilaginibacter conchicola]
MSSHHIVREKQEPALLVLSLRDFSEELLGQLLEWSPTVITIPDVAEQLAAYEIKVDIIIADAAPADMQSDVKLIPQNNQTQVSAAMTYLTNKGYPAVNVVTRDVTLSDFEPYINSINVVIYSTRQKIYPVTSGFSKWKPANENVGILSVYSNLETTGLSREIEDAFVTTADGFFSLKFAEPFVFISEDID